MTDKFLAGKNYLLARLTLLAIIGVTFLGLTFIASAQPAMAVPKIAILPFDIRDAELEGDPFAKPKDTDIARMRLVADELKKLMESTKTYDVVDLSAYEADIEKAAPFNKCDGCEVEIAKKAGADLALTGFVDKLSDALISLQIFVRDTATGEMKKTMSAEVRGNTDELWLHGIRYLWKNRFMAEADKK
ncbi:MAG: DUF3280 domain-containing protein [Hyphomicrobium sp.]|nr:DUF3280 domain-containing protein [Hyphomicrobium sp.]